MQLHEDYDNKKDQSLTPTTHFMRPAIIAFTFTQSYSALQSLNSLLNVYVKIPRISSALQMMLCKLDLDYYQQNLTE